MILGYLRTVIGSAPEGFEALEYMAAFLLVLVVISLTYRLLRSMFGGF